MEALALDGSSPFGARSVDGTPEDFMEQAELEGVVPACLDRWMFFEKFIGETPWLRPRRGWFGLYSGVGTLGPKFKSWYAHHQSGITMLWTHRAENQIGF